MIRESDLGLVHSLVTSDKEAIIAADEWNKATMPDVS
jgi:hypothetical protein